jgi:pimeloyl-ACP methyl ester carboxylesterase
VNMLRQSRVRIITGTLAVCLACAAMVAGPARAGPGGVAGSSADCAGSARGRVLSSTALVQLSSTEVAAELLEVGLPGGARYGIETYRVVYCTVSASGRATTASGLLAVPHGTLGRLPVVVYEHSTVAAKTDAPSFLRETEGRLVPLFFASDGFAVVAPDYLGLGTSPGRHPYVHAASEASATLDMMRAADKVSHHRGVQLSRHVFITGFSQGGHATMATGQAVQQGHGPWRLAALAPMAGPYELSGAEAAAVLDPTRTDPQHAAVYMAYLITAWKHLYHLYFDPRQVFTAPYADLVEDLFDGTHGVTDIDAALPAPEHLFHPDMLTLITNPTGRYAAALRDNDVCRWAPQAPTRLYHSRGDRDVDFANAEQCHRQITARGGTARIVDMGTVDHVGTAITALPLIRTWFTELTTS